VQRVKGWHGPRSVGLLGLVALSACRAPTQVQVEVTTDALCVDVKGTSLTAGTMQDYESRPPAAETSACDAGRVGSLTIVPSEDSGALFGVRVVMGITKTPEQCVQSNYQGGCIVARRVLRFVPNETLHLPVQMDLACLDIPCGLTQTCRAGSCVDATIPDPDTCLSADGCALGGAGAPPIVDSGGGVASSGGASGAGASGSAGGGASGAGGAGSAGSAGTAGAGEAVSFSFTEGPGDDVPTGALQKFMQSATGYDAGSFLYFSLVDGAKSSTEYCLVNAPWYVDAYLSHYSSSGSVVSSQWDRFWRLDGTTWQGPDISSRSNLFGTDCSASGGDAWCLDWGLGSRSVGLMPDSLGVEVIGTTPGFEAGSQVVLRVGHTRLEACGW